MNINFQPHLTYIHVVASTTKKIPVKQTFPYVEYSFNLLAEHGIFDSFKKLEIWSDGCGKHFKTYATQAFMAHLQDTLQSRTDEEFVCAYHCCLI